MDEYTANIPEGQKRCSRGENCLHPDGPVLLCSEFYRNARIKSGLQSECKVCCHEGRRLYREKHADQVRECARRHRAKHVDELRERNLRYKSEHREELREANRRYRAEHAEEIAERKRSYRAEHTIEVREYLRRYRTEHLEEKRESSHRLRARKRNAEGTHTAADVRIQVRAQTDKKGVVRCWWCSKPVSDEYHVDHRVPLSKGGSNAPDNLVISCPTCNLSKNNKLHFNGRLL